MCVRKRECVRERKRVRVRECVIVCVGERGEKGVYQRESVCERECMYEGVCVCVCVLFDPLQPLSTRTQVTGPSTRAHGRGRERVLEGGSV